MSYAWMEPKKKRRQFFTSKEYAEAKTIEEAFWMRVQETKWFLWLPW